VREKENFLVVLDEQSTATDILKYLGRIVSGKPNLEVCLVHMLPPLPPQLREFRGSEDRDIEKDLDAELDVSCQRWTQQAETTARAIFDTATAALTRVGVPADAIRCISRQLVNHEDLISDILETAKENGCETIVIGRHSFAGIKQAFHRQVADKLVRKATGITIWVVEQPSAGSLID
jgi:nucleotide-binding universal stress UspA family protein